jgi:hypothetical protein
MIALGLAAVRCAAAHAPAPPKWEIFDSYPGAVLLCTQRVYGAPPERTHFTWWAYVTLDPSDKVKAFYEARHAALKASDTPWFTLRGPERQALSVHTAAGGEYPTCDRKPGPADATVIIVSSALPTDHGLPPPAPSLRFGTATRGCGDAFVTSSNAEGTEALTVVLDRKRLGLTTAPKTFEIGKRPAGLDVAVLAYKARPPYTALCSDVAEDPDWTPIHWSATAGRVTASISKAAPKPGQCYSVDVRLEGVAFTVPDREVVLDALDLKNVEVGAFPPLPCTP